MSEKNDELLKKVEQLKGKELSEEELEEIAGGVIDDPVVESYVQQVVLKNPDFPCQTA